jgi:hypothetical protein
MYLMFCCFRPGHPALSTSLDMLPTSK